VSSKFFFLVNNKRNQSVIVFAKFLLSGYGGAEKSTIELASYVEESFEAKIKLLGVDALLRGAQSNFSPSLSSTMSIQELGIQISLPFSPLWEFLLNRNNIIKQGSSYSSDLIWTYGIFGPAFIRKSKASTVYFIRSETDLGLFENYHKGINRFLYKAKMFIELVPRLVLQRDIRKAMLSSTVVANSKYMASLCKEIYDVNAHVIYPNVDVSPILTSTTFINGARNKIVFVGDGLVKGEAIFKKLANHFQEEEFVVFTRNISRAIIKGNIEYRPWVNDQSEIFGMTKLLIIPSQWREAYSRLAREAYLLKVPVIASNVGGIPEALEHQESFLVDDYKNFKQWISSIEVFLND
tara:strand:- start:12066 stop:13121 length:1056 start_codon:yes stop_codon:yes gene_type:complete